MHLDRQQWRTVWAAFWGCFIAWAMAQISEHDDGYYGWLQFACFILAAGAIRVGRLQSLRYENGAATPPNRPDSSRAWLLALAALGIWAHLWREWDARAAREAQAAELSGIEDNTRQSMQHLDELVSREP